MAANPRRDRSRWSAPDRIVRVTVCFARRRPVTGGALLGMVLAAGGGCGVKSVRYAAEAGRPSSRVDRCRGRSRPERSSTHTAIRWFKEPVVRSDPRKRDCNSRQRNGPVTRSINTHDRLMSAFKPSRRRSRLLFGSMLAVCVVLEMANAPIALEIAWLCGFGGWATIFALHEIAPGVLANGISLRAGREVAITEKTRSLIGLKRIPEHERAIRVWRDRLMFAFVLVVTAGAFLAAAFHG
jgi:hypothetical protein